MGMPINKNDVRELLREAKENGDANMVSICELALRFGRYSEEWGECEHVIAMNRSAMQEDE